MRPATGAILAGVSALGLLTAGWVGAQTPPARPETPAPVAPPAQAASPPGSILPPEETAPARTPASPDSVPSKDDAPDKDSGDEDKPDKAAAKPADEDKATEAPAVDPTKRQSHNAAVIRALDKITAETMTFEAKAGVPVRWKGLVFTLRTCQTSAPAEQIKDSMAWMQIRSEPRAQSEAVSREVFRGWMVASSPALHPLQHPIYDAWLVACRA